MTDRKSKRHLEFESLEAKELLSTTRMSVHHMMLRHHAAQVHRASTPVDAVALSLSGTLKGTYHVVGGGAAASFNGRGPLSPIGKAQLKGNIPLATSVGGQLTLKFGKRGKVFASITGGTPAAGYTYQITGGTKTFAGDSGSGVAVVSILSSNPAQTRGRFALSLQGSST